MCGTHDVFVRIMRVLSSYYYWLSIDDFWPSDFPHAQCSILPFALLA
jgi:hypothetical protein